MGSRLLWARGDFSFHSSYSDRELEMSPAQGREGWHGEGRGFVVEFGITPIYCAHFCAHPTSKSVIIWGVRIAKAAKEESGKPNKQ